MKKGWHLLRVGLAIIALLVTTGCTKVEKNSDKSKSEDKTSYLEYDYAGVFNDGVAVVTKTENFESIKYVIDEDFNVLFAYKGNNEFVGSYLLIADKDDSKKINILNKNGDIVYSYDDKEYKKKVELASNGLLIITEETNTYNTSKTVTGIYDIESKKYILEPSEEYVDKIRSYGDNMLTLNSEYTKFFNTKTKSIIKYKEPIPNEFKDGYSLSEEYKALNTYLIVYDDKGNKKEVKSLFKSLGSIKKHLNGMLFDSQMRIELVNGNEQITGSNVELFDLEKGTVKNLSDIFIRVEEAYFNENGNALIRFENQGNETYYTIIDKEGKMLFEPVKRNNEASFGAESNEVSLIIHDCTLYDGGYFFGEEDNIFKVIDKNNKVITTGEEYETFKSITNNSIIVSLKKPGTKEITYYKDLKGNKINLKINGEIKRYN